MFQGSNNLILENTDPFAQRGIERIEREKTVVKRIFWLFFLAASIILSVTTLSCVLDRQGSSLFGGNGGSAGGEDAGTGGEAGAGGEGGTAGAGGEGGTAGAGGEGGTAGAGGEGGTAGAGGEGGTAGAGGQGGTAGAGGQGGSGPITCSPGDDNTPTSVYLIGQSNTAAYAHFWLGADQYSAPVGAANIPLAGNTFPSQIVLSGLNGYTITFTGGNPVDMYSANTSNVPVCANTNFYSEVCLAKVAQDFRCSYFPTEEANCGSVTTVFSSLGSHSTLTNTDAGDQKVVASIRCVP